MFLSDASIKRPVMTLLLTVAALFFGIYGYLNMGLDLYPDVDLPVVSVISVLPGADPEIVDSDVTDIIEEEINTIEGVKTISSTSYESQSQIIVEFILSKDVDVAAQEIRDKINQVRGELPNDLEEPIVQKVDIASQPVIFLTVSGSADYQNMAMYADQVISPRLQTIPGVGSVVLAGYREREIRVWLDPQALEARGLAASDVSNAISAKHLEMPAGRVEKPDEEWVVKIKGEYETVEEMKDLVITSRNGSVVRLKDIADIADSSEDLRSIAHFNGMPAVGLGIRKQSGTNTVEVVSSVKEVLTEIKADLPEGISVDVAYDTSKFIKDTIQGVLFDLLLGALLTSLVMMLFLRNIKMTLISIIAIPTSIIASFAVMNALGFTLNNMTMMAMSLAIGLVIDDAIVVLENIYRHIERGDRPSLAAGSGTSEVGFAVIAATLAILSVFLPLAFMKGIIGRFALQFGLSMAMSVAISALVALALVPMVCSRLLGGRIRQLGGPLLLFEKAFDAFAGFYRKLLDLALTNRWKTIAVAIGIFAFGLVLLSFTPRSFTTQPDRSEFMVNFELPTGSSVEEVERTLRILEKKILSRPEVDKTMGATGYTGGVNSGIVFVSLLPIEERELSQHEIMALMREEMNGLFENTKILVDYVPDIGGSGTRNAEIEVVLMGPDVNRLDEISSRIISELRAEGGFIDLDSNLRLDKPEFRVEINRDLSDDLNVSVYSLLQNFNILFGGEEAGYFKEGGHRYKIRLKAAPEYRSNPEDLLEVAVRSSRGELVKSANLINIREEKGPNQISRTNRSRSVTIYANLDGISMDEAMDRIEEKTTKYLPEGPEWKTIWGGRTEVMEESFGYLFTTLLIAMMMIYVILGSQFESFIHPFTILTAIPLAAAGSFGLLLITGKNFDMMAFLGLILLTGLVAKNSILLVDFANQERGKGVSRGEALRKAGQLRLRPILMTAFTTIAALVPVALAHSEGGQMRAPMGVAVIGGMLTATFLTLVVIPCVYSIMDDLSALLHRLLGKAADSEVE